MLSSYSKLGRREKILFFAAIGFVFLVAMDRVVLGPTLSKMKVMDAEIEAKRQSIARNRRILSFQDSIVSEYDRYRLYFGTAQASEEEIIADHLREVETLASLQDITISRIKAGNVEENPIARQYQVSLDGEGTLSNVLTLINVLEESNYLFQIVNFSLSSKSKGSDVIKFTMELVRIFLVGESISSDHEGAGTSTGQVTGAESTSVDFHSLDVDFSEDFYDTESQDVRYKTAEILETT